MTNGRRRQRLGILAISAGLTLGTALAGANPAGVANFHRVNDNIYRGAQPTAQGFRNLAKIGVKVVIDLREAGERSRAEKRAVEAAGMRYVNVPLSGLGAPSAKHAAEVLHLMADPSQGPVFVHCKRGADRTGTMVACYRIKYDHWQNPKALAEAKSFGMHWFEFAMKGYVLGYKPAAANAPAVASTSGAMPAPVPAPALVTAH